MVIGDDGSEMGIPSKASVPDLPAQADRIPADCGWLPSPDWNGVEFIRMRNIF